MKKVYIGVKVFEWRWKQKHSCGHFTHQSVLGGSRPISARKKLSILVCPYCFLVNLVGVENVGVKLSE